MDDFIDGLVSELKPVRRRRPYIEALALAGICGVELGLWLAFGQARRDLAHAAQTTPSFWWKLLSFGLIAILAATTAIASLDPTGAPRRGLARVAAAIAGYLLVGALIGDHSNTLSLLHRLAWRDGIDCLAKVVLLSSPVMAGLGLMMRNGAATHAVETALACGVAAAAWAAFVFSLACMHDDTLYVAVWYTLGCLISASLAGLVLPSLARW
jgi:hypothetical protein